MLQRHLWCAKEIVASTVSAMATLSNLVSALAHVTGLPEATVFAHGRFAREAGLISQAGRGLGGAQMAATDATNLLLAVGGTRVTREAEKTIRALRQLPGEVGYYKESPLELTQWMERYRSFAISQEGDPNLKLGTFVDFLMTEACTGAFENFLRSLRIYNMRSLPEAVSIFDENQSLLPFKSPEEIDVNEDMKVELIFDTRFEETSFLLYYNMYLSYQLMSIKFRRPKESLYSHDLKGYWSISQKTIIAMGDCLRVKDRGTPELKAAPTKTEGP
jgi:hypothetical protein